MIINEENVVMVDLDLSQGVISSINSENNATVKRPTFFNTEETPLDHEEGTSILRNGSHLEKEVEETEIKKLEPSLESLSAAELDYDTKEPTIAIPPSPRLTTISKELEPLSPLEEDEMLSSLDEETEVEALLDDYSKEEKEKEPEKKSVDLTDPMGNSRTPDLEIQQKLKESLPEEIRRLIYPADYPEAETMESSPEKKGMVPMNTAKAILKRKKLGAKQRKRLRKSKDKLTKKDEEPTNEESGCQIWWKDETIMRQILANPELYPPPDGFPSELLASNTEDEPEPTFWDMEEDDDESFTIG